ncbi:MAG: hypothetical protein ABR587_06800 [Candidatus Binatia bacterium]
MTVRRASWLLWFALVLGMPVPFFLVETGFVPVAALLQMLAVVLLLIATEGNEGAVLLMAGILAGQAFFAMALFALVSTAVAYIAGRIAGPRGLSAMLVLASVLIVAALFTPVYRTPFRATGLHSTLAEVFE